MKEKENQVANQEYISSSEIMDLERERIKSNDKRTEIARLAIEKNDEADERMFNYHMAKLNQSTEVKSQQVIVAKNLIYGACGVIAIVITALLYFSFFGDDQQSKIAFDLFNKGLTALSGIGMFLLGKGAFNKLTTPPSE